MRVFLVLAVSMELLVGGAGCWAWPVCAHVAFGSLGSIRHASMTGNKIRLSKIVVLPFGGPKVF